MEFQLTPEQQYAFDQIESRSNNFLIHGKPGTGKSVLSRALISEGKKFYHIAAPTGLAALNAGGRTLHSLFAMPVSEGIIDPTYNKFTTNDNVLRFARYSLKHLIIDEISMVRADTFDFIDRFLRMAKENDQPFGGVQIIAVGDFFQLPPVCKKDDKLNLARVGYDSEFAFSAKTFQSFETISLDEVLRQKGDTEFIDLLNNARMGSEYLKSKQMVSLNARVGFEDDLRIILTGTNAQADQVNGGHLRGLPGEPKIYQSKEFGQWPAYPCEQRLSLKVGAQVMVKMNGADKPEGHKGPFVSRVVNGTLAKVMELTDNDVTVDIGDGEPVKIYRKRWERKIKEKDGEGKWSERVVSSFEQIPLALAWAISIHKSQGQTFERVHIDATKIFAAGQLYVALSRCKTLAGLTLEGRVSASKFWANQDVVNFVKSLESIKV